jgi:23S rRNA pseudouridine2605 synthase
VRLAKYLAHCGVASRRKAEALIAAGRVTVAGKVVTDPARDVDQRSGVAFDGEAVRPEPHEVWALNKPLDVVSTAREPGARQAVTELVPSKRRLYPVGRLDADSTGLILLTNDGELANRLTHPRYGVERTYRATLRRAPSERDLARLRKGVRLGDGPTRPAKVRRAGKRGVEITIREGRNRQVRRMAEAIGNEVVLLRRVGFGPLRLGRLAEGEARRLRAPEVRQLWKDARRDD